MLTYLTIALAFLTAATWRLGGPVRALCIGWLVCLTPVGLHVVSYDFVAFASNTYIWLIIAAIGAFLTGAIIGVVISGGAPPKANLSSYDWQLDFDRWWPVARGCIIISAVAVVCMIANVIVLGGQLFNLAALREEVIQRESANAFARIGAITLWACFFCYGFALFFRDLLTARQLATLFAAAVGILLSALTTAGRQAPLQLVLLTLFIEAFRSQRLPRGASRGYLVKFVTLSAAASLIVYVTVSRTSADYANKADVFLRLFQASIAPGVDTFLARMGNGIRDVGTEAILYISHTVPLFAISSEIDYGGPYYGALDFPFILRQLKPITGIDPERVLALKVFSLDAEKVIGVGWDTGLSALIMDCTVPGMVVAMALFGYASQRVITKVRLGSGYPMVVIASVLMLTAAYTPYFSAIGDTNIMFLLIACALMMMFWNRRSGPGALSPFLEPVQPTP